MEHKKPPKILTDVGLSMFVDTIKLRELPLAVVEIGLKDLIWQFDMPVWEKDGTNDWNLTPWEVIKKEDNTTTHQRKVEKADISFPIIITKYNSRYVALDGIHRLVKTYMEGGRTIKAKIIPESYLALSEYQSN